MYGYWEVFVEVGLWIVVVVVVVVVAPEALDAAGDVHDCVNAGFPHDAVHTAVAAVHRKRPWSKLLRLLLYWSTLRPTPR